MLAVRKLSPKSVKSWEEACLKGQSFDSLSMTLIKEWVHDDNQVSIYVIDDLAMLPDIAMGLTMVTGLGPRGAQFFVVELAYLKSAGLTIHKKKSETQCAAVDDLHHDVAIKSGADLRKLIEVFIKQGKVRDADHAKVENLAVDAVQTGRYDIPGLAQKLKDPVSGNEVQKVCNSTLRIVGSRKLSVS